MAKVKVDINAKRIANSIKANQGYWYGVSNEWRVLIDKFVPFDTGILKGDVDIDEHSITYNQEYAKANYYGTNRKFRQGNQGSAIRGAKWNELAKPTQLPKLIRYAQNAIKKTKI